MYIFSNHFVHMYYLGAWSLEGIDGALASTIISQVMHLKSASESPLNSPTNQSSTSISIFLLDGFPRIFNWYPKFNVPNWIYFLYPETNFFWGEGFLVYHCSVILDQKSKAIFDPPCSPHLAICKVLSPWCLTIGPTFTSFCFSCWFIGWLLLNTPEIVPYLVSSYPYSFHCCQTNVSKTQPWI